MSDELHHREVLFDRAIKSDDCHAIIDAGAWFLENAPDDTYKKDKIADAYYNRGAGLAESDNTDAAISDYTISINLNIYDTLVYHCRGLAFATQGKYDAAIADYTQTLDLDERDSEAHYHRGVALAAQEKYDAAFADFHKALAGYRYRQKMVQIFYDEYSMHSFLTRDKPVLLKILYHSALIFTKCHAYDDALVHFAEAIELDASYVWAYNGRGVVYAEQGVYYKAIKNFDRAIRLDAGYANAYFNRGLVYYHQGKPDKMRADFTKVVELAPEYMPASIVHDPDSDPGSARFVVDIPPPLKSLSV